LNARSATTDPLTGPYNSRFFHEVLNRETARSQRYFTTLSLLMIDLDSFKGINDTHGHPAGDKVLFQIAGFSTRAFEIRTLCFAAGS
jgi:diguanylate cyclase (GGDEF)-like protein